MANFNVALLQIDSGTDLAANLEKGITACHKAKDMGADLALFPEMWSCGYTIPEDPDALKKLAITADHDFITAFGKLAKELDMAIGITLLESWEPLPRNTLVVFDRHGQRVLNYAKVHTCDFGDECRLTPGDGFYTCDLDTKDGNVCLGAMICYDREFPESARILMLQGAEIIAVPNACPLEINRLSQLRGRAYENMVGIATCNFPQGHPDCNGHSAAYDGVAYLPTLMGSRDTCIAEAGGEEGIYMASFDMDMLRDYRSREVHGNAYRLPKLYGALVEDVVKAPFIRKNKR